MSTRSSSPGRRLGAAGASAAALALVALSLSGCGGSSSSDNATSGSSDSGLSAKIETMTKPVSEYEMPTEKVSSLSEVKGKVIYYIPISLQSPQFALAQKSVTKAAKAAGASVQTCDGKGTPTDIASCVEQATKAKAAGIIADAIPYGMAANAFSSAQKKGIPVVIGNQADDAEHPAAKDLTYINAPGADMMNELSEWILFDSDEKATVLVNRTGDSPAAKSFVTKGTTALTDCSGCKMITNDVSSANFSQAPASTSSALLKNPKVNYVVTQFEQFLQPTTSGVQQAGKTSSVKITTGAAGLSSLKQLSAGNIVAASGQASVYEGWTYVDAILRMNTGQDVPEYRIPTRLFTEESIKDIELTDAAQDSGQWYGPTTFPDDFKKLWGSK